MAMSLGEAARLAELERKLAELEAKLLQQPERKKPGPKPKCQPN